MNQDGFGNPAGSGQVNLFAFGSHLYAWDANGLYRMELMPCLSWESMPLQGSAASSRFFPLAGYMFQSLHPGELWWIAQGSDLKTDPWTKVTSVGPIAGSSIIPMAYFQGQVYAAIYSPGATTFDIWRSPDLGKAQMTWSMVAYEGFGDPQNRRLAFMPVFKNKILAVTTETRGSVFGDPNAYGKGIEVWESPNGNPGTWIQVNQDGFGTETTFYTQGLTIRTNQDAGCFTEYLGYLYIGTLSHYGAEVWRYDGNGLQGWTSVTPSWAGVCDLGCGPGRDTSMAVFQGYLYMSEGFPTGNLARYDGSTWSVMVNGPNPFHQDNGGLNSLAVLGNQIYVSTLHSPYVTKPRGDQVYGFPFTTKPSICERKFFELLYDPPKFRWQAPEGQLELISVIKNQGDLPLDQPYQIGYYLDGVLVHQEPGPLLAPGQEAELVFNYDVPPGEHQMTLVADVDNRLQEQNKLDNRFSFTFNSQRLGAESSGAGALSGGLSVWGEAIPLCSSRASSHRLTVSWNTGGLPVRSLVLEVQLPDGTSLQSNLVGIEGSQEMEVAQFAGGLATLILQARVPGGVEEARAEVQLPPCTGEPPIQAEMMTGPFTILTPGTPQVEMIQAIPIQPIIE